MAKKVVHMVLRFEGGLAQTSCGDVVEPSRVTAYPSETTCKKCRKSRKRP